MAEHGKTSCHSDERQAGVRAPLATRLDAGVPHPPPPSSATQPTTGATARAGVQARCPRRPFTTRDTLARLDAYVMPNQRVTQGADEADREAS
jgi:hypothetical protein